MENDFLFLYLLFLSDITLPEPTANEVKMLKAELEKFTKVEVKANAYRWMR